MDAKSISKLSELTPKKELEFD